MSNMKDCAIRRASAHDSSKRSNVMATGRITTIRADKGFGFINDSSGNGNNDLFFHRSAVVGIEFDDLREGQEVSFESGPDPRDPSRQRATDVRLAAAEGA
jgi:CspA family cold shock protein